MWIEEWYNARCDGQWEHNWGVAISTTDNPGWSIKIDLQNTDLADLYVPWTFAEQGEHDWYGYKFENSEFYGAGDPCKLEFLISVFKKYAI